jgi:hypothetical protein
MKADMHSVTVHDLSNVAHIYDERAEIQKKVLAVGLK